MNDGEGGEKEGEGKGGQKEIDSEEVNRASGRA
jgi:hypothetical protein